MNVHSGTIFEIIVLKLLIKIENYVNLEIAYIEAYNVS